MSASDGRSSSFLRGWFGIVMLLVLVQGKDVEFTEWIPETRDADPRGTMLMQGASTSVHTRPMIAAKAHQGIGDCVGDSSEQCAMRVSTPGMSAFDGPGGSSLPNDLFGLEDPFDESNKVEAASQRATAAATELEVLREQTSFALVFLGDLVMGALGAATMLYLKAWLRPAAPASKKLVEISPSVEAKSTSISEAWRAFARARTAPFRRLSAAASAEEARAADDVSFVAVGAPANSEEDPWGCSSLHIAAAAGDVSRARALLQEGVFPDLREAWEETPLHFAARGGHVEVCKILLSRGADIDARGSDGGTPLLAAAKAGQEAACQLLLFHGAGVANASDDELPPMLVAMLVQRMFPACGDNHRSDQEVARKSDKMLEAQSSAERL